MVKELTQTLMEAAELQKKLEEGLILRAEKFELAWVELAWSEDSPTRRWRAVHWRIRQKPPNWIFVKPPLDLVRQFAELRSAPEAEILRFTKRWGTLGICGSHPGFPVQHTDHCLPISKPHPTIKGAFLSNVTEGFEPIRFWRRYAWLFHAILELGRELSQAQPGKYWMWRLLFPESPHLPKASNMSGGKGLLNARYLFSERIAELYGMTGVREVLDFEVENTRGKGRWIWRTRTTRPFNLIGVLTSQACRLLCIGTGKWLCSGCRHEYSSALRNPKRGQANYCPKCRRDKVPQRAADERRRRRRSIEKLKLAEGQAAEEIARTTGSRVLTIRKLAAKAQLEEKTNGQA